MAQQMAHKTVRLQMVAEMSSKSHRMTVTPAVTPRFHKSTILNWAAHLARILAGRARARQTLCSKPKIMH